MKSLSTYLVKMAALCVGALLAFAPPAFAKTVFKPIPTQFIAALGDKTATSGIGAEIWGLWAKDPGPRGVRLDSFPALAATGIAPAQWTFNDKDWWLEEHGLIMEAPQFPIVPGRYVVTGNRAKVAVLTIHDKAADGTVKWELDSGATLYDVTHLGCRAARYKPEITGAVCTPNYVAPQQFPVIPGAAMPETPHCAKQDYQVLIVVGMAVEEGS